MKERIVALIEHAKSKKGAVVYFREDWECDYFSLNGKCFGRMDHEMITLKGDPLDNEAMREMYEDIIPGYYANKIHWNSIKLNTTAITTEQLKKMIDISYDLVFNKLTKKEKKAILEEENKK